MTVIKTLNGWTVEPSSRDERQHLEWLFEALREVYARPVMTEDSSQAKHSLPVDHTPYMAASG